MVVSALAAPPGPKWRPLVLIWESDSSRLERIKRIVDGCEADFRHIEDPTEARTHSSAASVVALVGLGQGTAEASEELSVLDALKRNGFTMTTYANHSREWPLLFRCQVLLRGSSQLLDSATATFEEDLCRYLRHLFQTERARREEVEDLQSLMARMGVVGKSPAILSAFRRLVRVSSVSDVPVLLQGETGTGKELFARAICHLDPKRSNAPFVTLNCGALPPGLVESELFGHARGAFTGAERNRKGFIRSADGGVLFLDEVGELDISSQVKLLRVLQENRVVSLGEDTEVSVNIRVIAATNRSLPELVRNGTFREDLFHRLNVISISVPPLRERREDIRPLLEHFLKRDHAIANGRDMRVSEEFISALELLEFPGNVRQLQNLVRQALLNKSEDTPLGLKDLPEEVLQELTRLDCKEPPASLSEPTGLADELARFLVSSDSDLSRALEYCERLLVQDALTRARGNQSQTARLLGITPRSVYNKVRKYRLRAS